jgi:hypothetical protein
LWGLLKATLKPFTECNLGGQRDGSMVSSRVKCAPPSHGRHLAHHSVGLAGPALLTGSLRSRGGRATQKRALARRHTPSGARAATGASDVERERASHVGQPRCTMAAPIPAPPSNNNRSSPSPVAPGRYLLVSCERTNALHLLCQRQKKES